MDWRQLGAAVALCLLVVWRFLLRRAWLLDQSLFAVEPGAAWDLSQLLLASVLTIFLELALIRWIAVEVRVFAYVKNLALLLCFLGFGIGCALARARIRWFGAITALIGLLVVVRWPWYGHDILEALSQTLGTASDLQIWATPTTFHIVSFLIAFALAFALLAMVTFAFVPLGQIVSRQMDLAPSSLRAYSWNLAGNLAGILAFFAASWASLPPSVWLTAGLAGLALLQRTRKEQLLVATLMVPAVLLLHDPSTPTHFSVWTPYQQLDVQRRYLPDGELDRIDVGVNHTGYQSIVNLSPDFLQRHPQLMREPADENPYNVPFRFTVAAPRVLIVGSGTGNDVAAALRHGSSLVDAVEIDPRILALGQREHPERPYSSAKVSVHLTDARALMRRTRQQYDLVLFGLLDSHTQLSDYANMRIDNFVYTQESFREARNLLAPNGIIFVKFQVNYEWMGKRLNEMLSRTFGKSPVVFTGYSTYTAEAACFAISPSNQVEQKLAGDPRLAQLVANNRPPFLDTPPVPPTTDDWPYLYHKGHWIPRTYVTVGVLVLLLAGLLYWSIPEARAQAPSLFFFAMGAGFLLLETQTISRLALYFGTTWQVNGIAIAALLTTLVGANLVVEQRTFPHGWVLAGLLAGLGLAYLVPFSRIPASATFVGVLVALVFSVPVFFAGLLFASEFHSTRSPSAALAANMLGAVAGGLLENASLIVGMKALLLVAAGLYLLAAVGLKRPTENRELGTGN